MIPITVLMTVYNDEVYISAAIESILSQTFTEFEFVIVDDGFTDNTSKILENYLKKDSRIKVYSQENMGTTVAANNGLSFSKGKYVARLDSDDISYPNRLKIEYEFLESHPEVLLVGGGAHIIDKNGKIIGERNINTNRPSKTLMHRCIFQQSDVMFRREVLSKVGGYREKFKNAQDYDLWLRIADLGKIAKLNTVFGQWRLNGGGYTLSRKNEQRYEVKIIKKFARERKILGYDSYENYSNDRKYIHRNEINVNTYNLWISYFLFQSLKTKECRSVLRPYLKGEFGFTHLLLYFSSYLPKSILKISLKIRNVIYNNFGYYF